MKFNNLKTKLAVVISAAAMLIASSASSLCWVLLWEEPEMPESLYK